MAKPKLEVGPTPMAALVRAVEANTRALRALTKRLNEQTIDTDAVSVVSLTARAAEDIPEEFSA